MIFLQFAGCCYLSLPPFNHLEYILKCREISGSFVPFSSPAPAVRFECAAPAPGTAIDINSHQQHGRSQVHHGPAIPGPPASREWRLPGYRSRSKTERPWRPWRQCLPSDKCVWQVNSPKLKEGHLSSELLEIQSAVTCCLPLENAFGPFV